MGEEAEWLIDQMIFGCSDGFEDEWEDRPRREATEVAEEFLRDAKRNKRVQTLNEGVIKW